MEYLGHLDYLRTRVQYFDEQMRDNLSQVDAHSARIAVKCLKRLSKRFGALTLKGKILPVAITAIARELVGFIWAMMQSEPLNT